uniref:Transcriptional regulator n=1 Tax=Rhabditophanes sp. KR3021 TaxID=114890 RepID=A0AC35UGG8_9BILA
MENPQDIEIENLENRLYKSIMEHYNNNEESDSSYTNGENSDNEGDSRDEHIASLYERIKDLQNELAEEKAVEQMLNSFKHDEN